MPKPTTTTKTNANRTKSEPGSKPRRTTKGPLALSGSCQCGKVTFTVDSETPVPFMYCFCSICRKTSGSAFACNIMGIRKTLKVRGKRHLRPYHAHIREEGKPVRIGKADRWFCAACGTHLYLTDDRWPAGVWPNAAAIDTALPPPPAPDRVHLMLRFKPNWVSDQLIGKGRRFPGYPKLSIADWHEQHGWPITVRP